VTSIMAEYTRRSRKKFGLFPVWLPGTPMDLGDVGTLTEGGWTRLTGLTELGIDFDTRAGDAPAEYNLNSQVTMSTTGSVSAEAPLSSLVAAGVALTIDFHEAGSFVFLAEAGTVHRIDNLHAVDQQILAKFRDSAWHREWVVITEIVRAAPSLICVTQNAGVSLSIDLVAETSVAGVGAAGQAGKGLKRDDGFVGIGVTKDMTTVLWRGRYVNKRVLRAASVRERGQAGDEQAAWTRPPTTAPQDSDDLYVADIADLDEVLIG
jgi:hypothetical protein